MIVAGGILAVLRHFFTRPYYWFRKNRTDQLTLNKALKALQIIETKRLAPEFQMNDFLNLNLHLEQLKDTEVIMVDQGNILEGLRLEVNSFEDNFFPLLLEQFCLSYCVELLLVEIEQAGRLRISTAIDPVIDELPKGKQIHLYYAIREGMNNIIKHAEASLGKLVIKDVGERINIQLIDNGEGFDFELAVVQARSRGLKYMNEQIQAIGGQFCIRNNKPSGTIISITLPKS